MIAYWRSFCAELIKLKRQPLIWVHLLVPLAGIAIFLGYYSYTPFAPASKIEAYIQSLAIIYPALIGIVCGIAADQEAAAGQYQQLLVQPNRLASLAAKLTLLLLLGYGSCLLAAGGFGAGFIYLLKQSIAGQGFYAQAACLLFGSCLSLYFLHLFVSLRFGKGASIGLGIMESLIGALLLTGLGDRIWIYFPSAWPIRILTIWMQYGTVSPAGVPAELLLWPGILICIGAAVIGMILLGYWYTRWEGTQSVE